MHRNMPVAVKLGLGFGFVALLLVIIVTVSLINMAGMNELTRQIVDDRYAKVDLSNRIARNTLNNSRMMRGMLLVEGSAAVQKEKDKVEKGRAQNTEYLARLDKMINTPKGRELMDAIKRSREISNGMHDVFYNLIKVDRKRATDFALKEFTPANTAYVNTLTDMVDYQNNLMTEKSRESADNYAAVRAMMLTTGGIALLMAILSAFFITKSIIKKLGGDPALAADVVRRIASGDLGARIELKAGDQGSLLANIKLLTDNLERLAVRADAIGQGDFTREVPLLSEHDRLGHAVNNMNAMLRTAKAEDERRNWMKDGYNRLSGALTGDFSLQQLADTAIGILGRYLDAGRGVIYICASDGAGLVLLGSYMYTERANLGSRFKVGEGAVGQVAREKKPIMLTTIPPDAPPIVTGTTSAPPLYTYTYPLLREGALLGVVELASFERFDAFKQDFLSGAAEVIASYLYVGEQRQHISKLLTVAENAEREVRAHNEQLQEINARMEEQQRQLQQQTEELQHANAHMEEQQLLLQQQTEELQQANAQMEEQQQQLQQQTEELQQANAQMEEQHQQLEQSNQEMRRSQVELDAKARQLELSSQYKSEFLANMSHELRTPLNSIILLSKMMAANPDRRLGEEEIKRAEIIHRSGEDLLLLINDVLDLSKIEAGRMDLDSAEIPTAALATDLEELFASTAHDRGLDFVIEDRLQGRFVSDRDKISQILRNLLSNALKFTRQGKVTLVFERCPDESLPIRIEVRDTGIGIPKDKQELIFEAFRQVDGSTAREYGGTGLGLTISLRFAQLLGGTIDLQSIPGEGSVFSLHLPETPPGSPRRLPTTPPPRLPVAPAGAEQWEAAVKDDRDRLEAGDQVILLIDDDPMFGMAVVEINHRLGYKTLLAGSGAEGLALALSYHPAGILLDLGLPDMDGVDLLHEIKACRELAAIPVYVVSARDRNGALAQQGILGYLQKPVDDRQIAQAEAALLTAVAPAGGVLVVASGGIDAVEVSRLLGPGLDPVRGQVLQTAPGAELLAALDQHAWRLAIVDLAGLSIEAGLAVAETIRQTRADAALLFFGTHPLSDEDEARLRRYSDSIIVKAPQAEQRLLENIERFLREVPRTGISLAPGAKPAERDKRLAGRTILVVDDDPRNLFVITAALEQSGAHVVNAVNGRRALELLEGGGVDLVFMDIMMPEMDGYQTIAALRANPALARIPVVALTAKAMPQDREKTLEAGADDYLSKPVDYDDLVSMATRWSSEKR